MKTKGYFIGREKSESRASIWTSPIAIRTLNGRITVSFFLFRTHLPSNRFQSPRRLDAGSRERSGLRRFALRNTSLQSLLRSDTRRYSQYEEGYSKASPAVVSSAIASARLGARESLLKSALNFVSLCENRPRTATKYLA